MHCLLPGKPGLFLYKFWTRGLCSHGSCCDLIQCWVGQSERSRLWMTLILRRCSYRVSHSIWKMIYISYYLVTSLQSTIIPCCCQKIMQQQKKDEPQKITAMEKKRKQSYSLLMEIPYCPYMSGKRNNLRRRSWQKISWIGINPLLIAKLIPHRSVENVSFMIGSNFLDHWKD